MKLKRAGDLIDPFLAAEGPPPRALIPFIRWSLRGAWGVLTFAAVVSAVAGGLEAVAALLIGYVIDLTATGERADFLGTYWMPLAAIALYFAVLRPIFFGGTSAINSVVVQPNVLPLALSRLHRWTLGQAITFFDNDFAGRIAQKQMQTARALTDVVNETINSVIFAFASFVGSAVLLLAIDGWIALMLTVWLAAYFWLIRAYLPRFRDESKKRAAARAMVTGQVVDTITNMRTVKLFAHADHEETAALRAIGDFRLRSIDFGTVSASFRFMLTVLSGLLPVGLIGAATWQWVSGGASPGDIAAAGTVSIRIAQMTGWVSFTLMNIYASIGEVEDGIHTLTPPYELTDAPDAVPLADPAGAVRFENVGFAYGRRTGGVERIELDIRPGEKIGIVGASGAGKSTLVALLLRLYDPEAGRITIGGQDIAHVTQETLRRAIGMVTQETAMFNRSARDNILYGDPEAGDARMVAAAERASAHEFIQNLRDHKGREGYAAHLGERGVKLSGGQRQRIALARAILKDAPILVLDEATSALDSEVEAEIQAALEQVMVGKTVLAIAHRLSTLAQMDRIIVMDGGRIVEEGSHEALLANEGLYARYWNRQSGGFINPAQEAAE